MPKFIDRGIEGNPLPLIRDADLLATIHSMLVLRGEGTVKVSKVKGHADQAMVDGVMFGTGILLATMVLIRLPTWAG